MNHFLGLVLLSICISLVFSTISRDTQRERLRYFLTMMGYMVLGSLLASWLMAYVPW